MPQSSSSPKLDFEITLQAIPIPALIVELATLRVLAANDLFCELLGYTSAEVLAMTIDRFRPPEDIPLLKKAVSNPPPKDRVVWRYQRKDGKLLHVEVLCRDMTVVKPDQGVTAARFVAVQSASETPPPDAQSVFGS